MHRLWHASCNQLGGHFHEGTMVANVKTSRRSEMPTQVAPMLAVLSEVPVHGERYGYEFKWDGVRALAYVRRSGWRMVSRNGLEMQGRYPEFQGLGRLREEVLLDGEIVALGSAGKAGERGEVAG